jgi:hypothetical protein
MRAIHTWVSTALREVPTTIGIQADMQFDRPFLLTEFRPRKTGSSSFRVD